MKPRPVSRISKCSKTITTSAAYREAVKRRRCLIPMEFFFEWQKLDSKAKQPYAIALKNADLFAFAGLWKTWRDKASGKILETYIIVTTDPNELMERLHDRMPAILDPKDYERWLGPAEPSHLPVDLLRPHLAEDMKAWKVSAGVGNVRNNRPELIEPVE
jgi:putative SOS response-associated peptidase YedK